MPANLKLVEIVPSQAVCTEKDDEYAWGENERPSP
jgi:hypothetical protein